MDNRIVYRMKVTALLPDELVSEVRELSRGKNITESITIALSEWLKIQKLKNLSQLIENKPLEFREGYSAEQIRELNRGR